MSSTVPLTTLLLASALLATTELSPRAAEPVATPQFATGPHALILPALPLELPYTVDSNSPAVWDLVEGQKTLFVTMSSGGQPHLASGPSLTELGEAVDVPSPADRGGLWMEAVVTDDAGTWYGYYHNELPALTCGRPDRFVPRIGAARSTDQGRSWEDLGIILDVASDTEACKSLNHYVIGGVGDLSVMLDESKTDLYIFFSQYESDPSVQGVAVARLLWANRDRPVGRVSIWRDGVWQFGRPNRMPTVSPDGRPRLVWFDYPEGTPLVPTTEPWHDADNRVNAFWGPSVHWNVYLDQYVMLLNRAKDESYTQEGVYVSFAPRLDDPRLWSPPEKILGGGEWYPQVMGLAVGSGTDKRAGSTARFFMKGRSNFTITFTR